MNLINNNTHFHNLMDRVQNRGTASCCVGEGVWFDFIGDKVVFRYPEPNPESRSRRKRRRLAIQKKKRQPKVEWIRDMHKRVDQMTFEELDDAIQREVSELMGQDDQQ